MEINLFEWRNLIRTTQKSKSIVSHARSYVEIWLTTNIWHVNRRRNILPWAITTDSAFIVEVDTLQTLYWCSLATQACLGTITHSTASNSQLTYNFYIYSHVLTMLKVYFCKYISTHSTLIWHWIWIWNSWNWSIRYIYICSGSVTVIDTQRISCVLQ